MLTPQQIEVIQQSFAKIAPISDKAAAMFYGRLFEIAPDTRSLFRGDMAEQGSKLMATLSVPSLLLLDEHTASLDPRTVEKVLDLTRKIIENNSLSTLMVTHNMGQAIEHGNRMVMLHEGKVKFEIGGEDKSQLTVKQVIGQFGTILEDKTLLSVP